MSASSRPTMSLTLTSRAAADVELDAADVGGHRAHVRLGDVGDVHEVERRAAVARDDRRLAGVDAVEHQAHEPAASCRGPYTFM